MSGPEEDELPDWWRGPAVVETKPAPKPRAPRTGWPCTRAGCSGEVRAPWERRTGLGGVVDDYCSAGCVPRWVEAHSPTPPGRWRRSGGRA